MIDTINMNIKLAVKIYSNSWANSPHHDFR